MFPNIKDFKCSWLQCLPQIHRVGLPMVGIALVATIIMFSLSNTLGWVSAIIMGWVIFFFRDPERVVPRDSKAVVSPADGKVVAITEVDGISALGIDKKFNRVSIFLDIFDVHVNRMPCAGVVTKLQYNQGKFLSANLDKASDDNEKQYVMLQTASGHEVVVVQIAGLVARRIVCDLKDGQEVARGERFGIICFGSRVDLYLPPEVEVLVEKGQMMVGGETVICHM